MAGLMGECWLKHARTEWWANARDVERTSYDLQTIETVARGYLNTMQETKKNKKRRC